MKYFCLIFFLTIYLPLLSQSNFSKKEKILIEYHNQLKLADYDKKEKWTIAFEEHLKRFLLEKESWDYKFDTLSKRINIETSPNKKVRTFGWNEQMGGSWHTYKSIIQFKHNNTLTITDFQNKKILHEESIEGNEVFRDVIIHEIHSINRGFLFVGWGTHGGGHQHTILAFYKKDKNGHLIRNPLFENLKNSLVIKYPRKDKLNLIIKKNKISFNEFILDDEIGFYLSTGQKVLLKKKKGIFAKCN